MLLARTVRYGLLLAGVLVVIGATATCVKVRELDSQVRELDSEEHRYRVVTVVAGLEHPWGLAFLPGGEILVTEREGRVRLVRGGVLQPEPLPGGPEVRARGQGGLLDVAVHPRFAENRFVYLTYSKPGPRGATTALARARFDGQRLVGLEDIFVADAWGGGGAHFGSRIVFGKDGMLYITVGERNERHRAQDLADHAGTVIRLYDDGRVPSDNPFVGRAGAKPEILSYGHRNPQGLTVHPETGALWVVEHGARGGDEANVILTGRNYGWPVITYGIDYSGAPIGVGTHRDGMEQPVVYWVPSIATSGMAFYAGDRFPGWRGNLFVGALAGEHLRRVVLDDQFRPVHQEELLDELGKRIRDVRLGPDGYLYMLTDENDGALLRIEPLDG